MSRNPNCERLFLLEVLIENLKILHSIVPEIDDSEEDFNENNKFCLAVKLGNLPCFELCRTAADGELVEEDDKQLMKFVWNEGKNCLFPMTPAELVKILDDTLLTLNLRLNTSEDNSTTIGKTEVTFSSRITEF